jgi:hypothetical protein
MSNSIEMVSQGGVVRLLPRRCGTGKGRKVGSVAAFDNGDNAPVVGGSGAGSAGNTRAGSLYPSALQLARALRLEFVGRAT